MGTDTNPTNLTNPYSTSAPRPAAGQGHDTPTGGYGPDQTPGMPHPGYQSGRSPLGASVPPAFIPPAPGPVPPGPRRPSRAPHIAGLTAAVLMAGVAGLVATQLSGPSRPSGPSQLESVTSPGTAPYATPPVTANGAPAPDGVASCDVQNLIGQLQADPTKATAWAGVFGITTADIPGFVGGLNPTQLQADTAVIDHGYTNGGFTATPAVLQAGTAVFSSAAGAPTVKCLSGDPLTAAPNQPATVAGPAWPGFTPNTIAVTTPDPAVDHTDPQVEPQPDPGPPAPQPGPNPGPQPPAPNPPGPQPPAPNPNPGPPLPAGARYNYDGTILVPNGQGFTLLNPDGTVKSSGGFGLGAGVIITKNNPDGSFTLSDGTVRNPDGSVRKPVTFQNGATLNPDGTTTPKIDPAPKYNYDDTIIVPSAQGSFTLLNPDGTVKSAFSPGFGNGLTIKQNNPDGSYTLSNGTLVNADLSPRNPVTLPNGGTLNPDGSVSNADGTTTAPPMFARVNPLSGGGNGRVPNASGFQTQSAHKGPLTGGPGNGSGANTCSSNPAGGTTGKTGACASTLVTPSAKTSQQHQPGSCPPGSHLLPAGVCEGMGAILHGPNGQPISPPTTTGGGGSGTGKTADSGGSGFTGGSGSGTGKTAGSGGSGFTGGSGSGTGKTAGSGGSGFTGGSGSGTGKSGGGPGTSGGTKSHP